MAISKCSKCDNTIFEMVEKEIIGANFKIMFIQCNRCNAEHHKEASGHSTTTVAWLPYA